MTFVPNLGRYRVSDFRLGEGLTAVVKLAEDEEGKQYAVKIFRQDAES